MISNGAEDDDLTLSPNTLKCLNEYLLSNQQSQDSSDILKEDWQLSQFWYDEETTGRLVTECIEAFGGASGKICCISCPTLIKEFLQRPEFKSGQIDVVLLEYDTRFQDKYPEQFVQYDYKQPLSVPENLHKAFDLIIADPPFLSEECFVKVSQTIRLISRDQHATKLIVSTGTIMEELLRRLLKLKIANFMPKHVSNLGNNFSTFVNYEPSTF